MQGTMDLRCRSGATFGEGSNGTRVRSDKQVTSTAKNCSIHLLVHTYKLFHEEFKNEWKMLLATIQQEIRLYKLLEKLLKALVQEGKENLKKPEPIKLKW